jgi:hypothetical protein
MGHLSSLSKAVEERGKVIPLHDSFATANLNPRSHEDLLDNPKTLPILSLTEPKEIF